MIDKKTLDRWYDEGQKPLTAEQKKNLKDLVKSWNVLGETIRKIKFDKVPYPKEFKARSIGEIMEMITGSNLSPVNKEWIDLRIK